MTVERGLFALDHRVVAIDPHSLVVMRNGKGEDLPMKLLLALYEPEQFHDSSNSEGHTVCILSICHVECGRTALHFAREERGSTCTMSPSH